MNAVSRPRFGLGSVLAGVALLSATATAGADSSKSKGVDGFYGSFGTDIPITVPSFHGLEPTLKLVYGSTARNGFLGVGWALAGGSYIERASEGGGAPAYDGDDIYLLDGAEMVPCADLGGTHCTKIQNYHRIEKDGATWKIWRKDGTKAVYDPVVVTSKGNFRWGITKLVDTRGNQVDFGYYVDSDYDEAYLNSISYNGATIYFRREGRTDDPLYANGAGLSKTRYRLKTIDIKVSGTRARAYKLEYTESEATGRSQLSAVTQYGSDATIDSYTVTGGTSLPPMSYSYTAEADRTFQDKKTSLVADNSWDWTQDNHHWFMADIDGDGDTDACAQQGKSNGVWYAFCALSNGNGYFSDFQSSTIASNTADWSSEDRDWFMADVNGDGMADACNQQHTADGIWKVHCGLAIGNGRFESKHTSTVADNGWNWDEDSRHWFMVDVDGDGNADACTQNGRADGYWAVHCALSNGNGNFSDFKNSSVASTNNDWTTDFRDWYMVDVTGDGAADACNITHRDNGQWYMHCAVSLRDGTFADKKQSLVADNGWDWDRPERHWHMVDVNGDQKIDACAQEGLNWGWHTMSCALAEGDGTFAEQTYTGVADNGWDYTQDTIHWYMADVNGDGMADDCHDNARADGYWAIHCALSTGDGHFGDLKWDQIVDNSVDWSTSDRTWFMVDANGDGAADNCHQEHESDGQWRVHCGLSEGDFKGAGLVSRVENGLGGSTDVDYEASSHWSNTYLPLGLVFPTVGSVTTSDGRGNSSTASYSFDGGLWSNTERRFLGFRKVTAVLDAAGNYTETYYHQHVGCIAKPETTYFKDASGNIYSYSQMYYDESANAPYTSLMTERWDYECNLDSSCRRVVSQLAYDVYGSVITTKEYGDYDLTGDERTTVHDYYANTTDYIVGLSGRTRVYAGIGTGGQLMQETRRKFDGQGAYYDPPIDGGVTQVKKWNSTTGGWQSSYASYDSYGNTTSETNPEGYSISRSFDSTYHKFITESCNEAGQCTGFTYDTVLGQQRSMTDPNGNTTSYDYDVLGRPTVTTNPDGSTTNYSYISYGNVNWQRHRVNRGGQWVQAFFDGAQRVWQKKKSNGDIQLIEYSDASNRIWRESQWHDPNTESPVYTTYSYDGAGRVRYVTLGDGATVEYVYLDGAVKTIDENGSRKTVYTDPYGRTTKVQERNGGGTYTTTYEYDAVGNPIRVVDNGGKESTASWDSLGRKVSSCDMDMGCWTYEYNKVGNLVSQTDAKGRTVTLSWDALNRTTSKTYPDGSETHYYYDESGHGDAIGHLTRVTYPSGSHSMKLDNMGRVYEATRCVDGTCKTVSSTFNELNRVASVTYPDGEVVSYNYDGAGRLDSIPGYVDNIDYNARGQMTLLDYANGTSQTYNYSGERMWLEDTTMTNPWGVRYQASYSYDAGGRVSSVSSSTDSLLNVSYTYDEVGRLMNVSGAQTQSFTYWAIGNMTSNSDVGDYSYGDSSHRHAVTKAGGVSYSYDANGNMTSGAGRTMTWDAENRLASVTMDGQTTTFAYDDEGNRIKKAGPNGTTRYFGLVDVKPDGTLVKYVMANGQVAAKTEGSYTKWFHRDRLGSVQLLTTNSGAIARWNDFAAYGSDIYESGSYEEERGFGGHITDSETGLIYMNARYYDPDLGRFISPDSLVPDGPDNPQARNRYSYAFNNPISNVDPTGHAPVAAAVIGAAIGVATGVVTVAVAVVAVVCVTVGYVTKNPLLMSIGQVIMGFATGGVLGGVVAALTSPVSPLDPKLKQIIGWAYTVYCVVKTIDAQMRQARYEQYADQMSSDTPVMERSDAQQYLEANVADNDVVIAEARSVPLGGDNYNPRLISHTQYDYYQGVLQTDGTYVKGSYLGSGYGGPNGRGFNLVENVSFKNAGNPNAVLLMDHQVISGATMKAAISASYGSGGSYLTNWVCHNVTYAQALVIHGGSTAAAQAVMSQIGPQWNAFSNVVYGTPSGDVAVLAGRNLRAAELRAANAAN